MIQLTSPDVLFRNSCLYKNYSRREDYFVLFVKRLKSIPQLFPTDAHAKIRNRYVHVSNMLDILRLIDFNNDRERKTAMQAVLAHDVGHTPFGHAGEKAINSCLSDGEFFNFMQSQRLISHYEQTTFLESKSIFNTPPLELDVSFENSRFNSMSVVLDFIDDLENLIGDVKDHFTMYRNTPLISILQKFLSPEIDFRLESKELARNIIERHFSTFDFSKLADAVTEDRFGVLSEIKNERMNIIRRSKEIDEIMHFYNLAERYMCTVFMNTREILKDCYLLHSHDLNSRTIDHVSSLWIEGSSYNLQKCINT